MANRNNPFRKRLLILILIVIAATMTMSTLKMILLKKSGMPTRGIVVSKQKAGSKGKYSRHCNYWVGNKKYHGSIMFNHLEEGEEIEVLHLARFPGISVPKKFIDEYY